MSGLLWSLAIVAANWLGAIAGCAVSDRRYRRAGHDPARCDRWGPCEHERAVR
jgi:hypothetical protein